LGDLEKTGVRPDPRDAQITRLKNEVTALQERLAQSAATIDRLGDFRTQSLSRLAAQHDEITRLRDSAAAFSNVTRLPLRPTTPAPVAEATTPSGDSDL
ncbi:hypothetical protein B1B_13209, partial [mine drainage metagenome]